MEFYESFMRHLRKEGKKKQQNLIGFTTIKAFLYGLEKEKLLHKVIPPAAAENGFSVNHKRKNETFEKGRVSLSSPVDLETSHQNKHTVRRNTSLLQPANVWDSDMNKIQ